MKILCVSDQIDPLIYNQNAKRNFPDIDLILCAGDLPLDYVDFIVTVFNKPAYFIFGNHNLSEYRYYHGVRGALPPAQAAAFRPEPATAGHGHGAVYAGFKALRNKALPVPDPRRKRPTPLLIAGASGSLNYNRGLNQYSNAEMQLRLVCMIPRLLMNRIRYGRYLDIFLTHATPLHVHDHDDPCHTGFKCYNWFLRAFKPAYMVHGHIHLYDQRDERVTKYGETVVVNAFAHCVIDFPATDFPTERSF